MRPFKCDCRAYKQKRHTPSIWVVDLNTPFGGSASPVLVEEEANAALCLNAPVLEEEEAYALRFDLSILPLDNDNGNDLKSFVSIFLCHHSCSMLPLAKI